MIVTTGKSIRVEVGENSRFIINRQADTPGLIIVAGKDGTFLHVLCCDVEDLCAGLRRAAAEDVEYRKSNVEGSDNV